MELKRQDVAPPEAEAMAAAHLPRRRELAALAWQGQEALLGPMALLGPLAILALLVPLVPLAPTVHRGRRAKLVPMALLGPLPRAPRVPT